MSQILVIADDPRTRTAIERILLQAGHSVLPAQSASEGLRLLQTERRVAVITVDARDCEAHAAARWARCVARIITYPKDPRTLANWSRWLYASEGALRNWCWAAGISPRRSLVFGRLLRAVCRNDGGRVRLRNLLDVIDRRTVANLLHYAGFADEDSFPHDIATFLDRQQVVRDPEMIAEIKNVLVTPLLVPAAAAASEDYDGPSEHTRHATAADFQRDPQVAPSPVAIRSALHRGLARRRGRHCRRDDRHQA
jgi:hypothetical protein